MSKKMKLNTTAILNELTGNSRFFEKPNNPSDSQTADNTTTQQYDNIAILQLEENQVRALRQSTHKAQTFRFTEQEIEWLKDTAYELSKALPHRRVNQTDIVRIGIKFFDKALQQKRSDLLRLIEDIK